MTTPANAAAAEQAIAEMEGFRTKMRAIGQSSPTVEKFIDEVNLLITVYGDPAAAIDAVFAALAAEGPETPAVAKVVGARA
ncbi:hypothetical protein [Streptomyces sp. NPDC001221]